MLHQSSSLGFLELTGHSSWTRAAGNTPRGGGQDGGRPWTYLGRAPLGPTWTFMTSFYSSRSLFCHRSCRGSLQGRCVRIDDSDVLMTFSNRYTNLIFLLYQHTYVSFFLILKYILDRCILRNIVIQMVPPVNWGHASMQLYFWYIRLQSFYNHRNSHLLFQLLIPLLSVFVFTEDPHLKLFFSHWNKKVSK